MQKSLHPKAIISSTLFRISALLVVVEYFIQVQFYAKEPFGLSRFLSIALLLAIAYVIRSGRLWIRWLLLAIIIVGLFATVAALLSSVTIKLTTIDWCTNAIEDIIQITATILLFIPYHVPTSHIIEESDISLTNLNSNME
jgi:hypothetical protein